MNIDAIPGGGGAARNYVIVHRGGPPGVPHGVAGVQLEEIHDAYDARLHEVEGRFQILCTGC
jgi:hypothetical protein